MIANLKANRLLSELVAENAATSFLDANIGMNLFIGADIEELVAQNAQIIYQNVDDPNFSGASISYRSHQFVVLNTSQSLRSRYYSAAHEMWHLALAWGLFGEDNAKIKVMTAVDAFDMERAADHFAAAVMLPKNVVIKTWAKYVEQQNPPELGLAKNAIVRIANLSAVPYVAVCRRLVELGVLEAGDFIDWGEQQWQAYLNQTDFPPSPLDQAIKFNRFSGLAQLVKKQVADKQLTLVEAANFLTDTDPERARDYLKAHQALVAQLSSEEHDE